MLSILIAVAGLSLLIVVHELGHFLAAKAFGMRVTHFSLGVGPAIASYRAPGADTCYELRAIPFAAYVRIDGVVELPAGEDGAEQADDPRLYHRQGLLPRIVVNAAGPFANYMAASAMIFALGVTGYPTAVPSAEQPGSYVVVERRLPLHESARKALVLPAKHTVAQLSALGAMIREGSTERLTGPVGMGKIVADQAERGATALLSVLILLSIGLGLFNLLPIPGLDGGKLLFLAFEAVTRRRPSPRVELVVHGVGLLLLLGVVALVTVRDVFFA